MKNVLFPCLVLLVKLPVYPITPEATEGASQCPPRAAWVIQPGNAFIHVVDDAPRRLLVELAKLSPEPIAPGVCTLLAH